RQAGFRHLPVVWGISTGASHAPAECLPGQRVPSLSPFPITSQIENHHPSISRSPVLAACQATLTVASTPDGQPCTGSPVLLVHPSWHTSRSVTDDPLPDIPLTALMPLSDATSSLLLIQGHLNREEVTILIDGGTKGCFVSDQVVRRLGLRVDTTRS